MAKSMIFSIILHGSLALFTPSTIAARNLPEVIPGPGMPSLASLNLTSADLYNMALLNVEMGPNHADPGVTGCYSPPVPNNADTSLCYQYLEQIGDHMCAGNGPHGYKVNFCQAGTSLVTGYNDGPDGWYGSVCKDVAFGINDVINRCRGFEGNFDQYGGYAPAWANGYLVVEVSWAPPREASAIDANL